jgi:hypothetical protein
MPDITFTPFNNYLHSQEQGTPFVISVVTNAAATSISPVVTSQLPPPPPPPTTSGGFDNLNYYSTAYVSLDNKRSRVTTLTTKGLDDEDSAAIREIKLKVFDVAGTDSNVYFKVDETALSGSFDTFKIVHGDNETDVLSSTVSNGKIYFNLPRMLEDTTDYTLKYKTKTNVVAGIASFTDKEIDLVSFYENTEIDTVLFTFTATTTDGAEFTTGATYTFVSGNEAGHFEIDGNQVKTTSIPVNYETPTVSITLRIKGSMGGAEVDHDFTVIVNNRNESPTAIAFTKVTGLNTDHTGSIGTLSTTDPDAGDTHTYEISGTDKFVITNSNEVHVAEGATLVAGTLYGFTIKSTDVEQLSVTVDTFSYTFSSVNAAPTEITFTEETGLNTDHTGSVGTLATTDADDGDSHTYTLTTTGGAAHATLEIKNANEVHVKSGVTLTADTPYTFKITTNDGNGGTFSDTFSYTFSSANAAPTDITFTPETGLNTDHTGKVGTLATTDPDAGDTHTYTLVTTGGAAHATLEIKNTNEVHVKTDASLTAETPYTFKITSTDAGGLSVSVNTFSVTFSAAATGDVTQTITFPNGSLWFSLYAIETGAKPVNIYPVSTPVDFVIFAQSANTQYQSNAWTGQTIWNNSDFVFSSDLGYVSGSTEEMGVTFTGPKPSATVITIVGKSDGGWSWMGYPSIVKRKPEILFTNPGVDTVIFSQSNNTQYQTNAWTGKSAWNNLEFEFEPGKAYQIKNEGETQVFTVSYE